MKLLLTLALILYLDVVAIQGLMSSDQWTWYLSLLWIILLALGVGLLGGLQAVGWVTFESAWSADRSQGGIQKGLEVLGGRHGFARAAAALLRLLSGACLLFGGLSLLLKVGFEHKWFEQWDIRLVQLLLLQWFRLAALGLSGILWAPLLTFVARGAFVHTSLAVGGSALSWWVMFRLFGPVNDDFWQLMLWLLSWFPTYGCALLWGGVFWCLPSRLAGRRA